MPVDVGAAIADRAAALVGTPFRVRGRKIGSGLDCVGVVAEALAVTGGMLEVPRDYTLRGEYLGRVCAFFDRDCFHQINTEPARPGDILLCRPADRQVHFVVSTTHGAVHAHAGLQRVVVTPPPLPWPIIGHWRYIDIGD